MVFADMFVGGLATLRNKFQLLRKDGKLEGWKHRLLHFQPSNPSENQNRPFNIETCSAPTGPGGNSEMDTLK